MGKQVELLENHANLGADGVETAGGSVERDAVDDNLTGFMLFKAVDTSDQGRFARTGGTANNDAFTQADIKRYILQCLEGAEKLGDSSNLDYRLIAVYRHFVPSRYVDQLTTMFTLMQQIYNFAIVMRTCKDDFEPFTGQTRERRMNLIKAASAALFVFALGAQASAQSALQDILNSGTLKVGTTGDWNPMTMKNPADNSYTGYDIDVMTELAKDLGVEVEFVPTDWKTLVSGVTSGKYHITGSASISPARAKAAGYSTSYFSLATVPLILGKNKDRFMDWADLDKGDVTVAATLGTTQEKQVKQFFPSAQHKIVEAPARDFQEVLAGRADAHITSNVEANKLVEKYPQMMIVPVEKPKAPTPIAMLLPQGDQVWINYVNTWIALKQERGFFDGLGKKWKLLN